MAVTLTDRQLEVAKLVTDCLTNKEIAVKLGISEQTVKNHVNDILVRLGAKGLKTRVAIAKWYLSRCDKVGSGISFMRLE